MKKLQFIILLGCFSVVTAFAGGQSEERTTGASQDLPELVQVSYVRSPFNLPAILMKRRGTLSAAFEEVGVQVEYHEITSGAKQAQAMAAGSLDIGGVMNTTSVILARSGGNRLQIVAGFSRPDNMFAIMVKDPSITSLRDLAGKRVAGPKGTVLHQLLSAALAAEGMDIQQVDFLQMGLPQASTALLAGHIDAALLAGSLVIKAKQSGARVLTTADGLVAPKLVIVARGDFAETYPELVDLYCRVHADSVSWMQSNLEEALRIGAEEQGISVAEARQLYEWTEFISTLDSEDVTTMRDDIAFLQAQELLQKQIDPLSFIAEGAISAR